MPDVRPGLAKRQLERRMFTPHGAAGLIETSLHNVGLRFANRARDGVEACPDPLNKGAGPKSRKMVKAKVTWLPLIAHCARSHQEAALDIRIRNGDKHFSWPAWTNAPGMHIIA